MNDLTRRGFIFGTATIASYGLLVGVQRACFSAFAEHAADDAGAAPVTIVEFADDERESAKRRSQKSGEATKNGKSC